MAEESWIVLAGHQAAEHAGAVDGSYGGNPVVSELDGTQQLSRQGEAALGRYASLF